MKTPLASNTLAFRIRRLCDEILSMQFNKMSRVGRMLKYIWFPDLLTLQATPNRTDAQEGQWGNYRGLGLSGEDFLSVSIGVWRAYLLLARDTEDNLALLAADPSYDATKNSYDVLVAALKWIDIKPQVISNDSDKRVFDLLNTYVELAIKIDHILLEYESSYKADIEANPGEFFEGVLGSQWVATMNSLYSYRNYSIGYTAKLDDNDTTTVGCGHGPILAAF